MTNGYRVAGYAAGGAVATQVGMAEASWLVEQGAEPEEAIKRTVGANSLRLIAGIFAAPWLLVFYIAGLALTFAVLPEALFRYNLGWETPMDGGDRWYTQGVTDPNQRYFALFALLGAVACFLAIYAILLFFAHIWRWQSDIIPGYNDGKRWWRLYRRPTPQDIFPPGDERRKDLLMNFSVMAKWLVIYAPVILLALFFGLGSLYSIVQTLVHNL